MKDRIEALFGPDEEVHLLELDRMHHVGWGGKHCKSEVWENPVHEWFVYEGSECTYRLTLEPAPYDRNKDYFTLGIATNRGQHANPLWDIAYGWVNGFPLKDILWYVLTRQLGLFLPNGPYTKEMHKRSRATKAQWRKEWKARQA